MDEDQAYCPECDQAIQGPPLYEPPAYCPHCKADLMEYEDDAFELGVE